MSTALLSLPFIPILIVVLVCCLVFKAAKGCVKLVAIAIVIVFLIQYALPWVQNMIANG